MYVFFLNHSKYDKDQVFGTGAIFFSRQCQGKLSSYSQSETNSFAICRMLWCSNTPRRGGQSPVLTLWKLVPEKHCISTVDASCQLPVVPPLELGKRVPTRQNGSLLWCIYLLTHLSEFFQGSTCGRNFPFFSAGGNQVAPQVFRPHTGPQGHMVLSSGSRTQKPPISIYLLRQFALSLNHQAELSHRMDKVEEEEGWRQINVKIPML